MEVARPDAVVESGLEIAKPYAAASQQGSKSPVAGAVEPTPKAKPRRKFNRDNVDSARYLFVPGPESEMQATVALEGRLEDRLSQMQDAIARLESGTGGAPLMLLHQTEINPTGKDLAVEGEEKLKGEVPTSSGLSRRNGDFMFTSSELMDAHQRWNKLMEARQRGLAPMPVASNFTPREMETAHRRGLAAGEESRDLAGEMAGLVDALVPSSDPQFCALR